MKDIQIQKQLLRKEYILKRNNIENKKEKSTQIFNKIINTNEYKQAKIVALYKNLASEVDTNELIKHSIRVKKIVALPRVVNNNLEFFKINSLNDKLIKSEFGVEEPIGNKINFVNKDTIDLMIVPGVCFDKNKNRMGFGKGFYDKYLEETSIETIGICFFEQIVENIPTTTNDITMNKIITDKIIYQ